MKISSFTTQVVSVPRDELPPDGLGSVASVFVLLRLRTDDGVEGLGYGAYVHNSMVKSLRAAVEGLAEQTIGEDPMTGEAVGAKLLSLAGRGAAGGAGMRAVAAIDVALWDIKGKALGQPVYRLLGGFRDLLPTYASGHLWRTYDLRALAEFAPRLEQQGFRAMKFRMGGEDSLAKELERMRVMRESVGPGIDIMVDINQGWNVHDSIAMGRAMEKYGLYWFEDPTNHQDYQGMARIADALDVPVASGEYHFGVAPFRQMLEHRSADIVMVDLLRVGGITPWMKVAHMAEAFNVPIVSHLATEFLMHAMAAVPNGLTVEHMPWSFPLYKEPPRMGDGMLVLPQKPGFGLELDEAAVKRFAVD